MFRKKIAIVFAIMSIAAIVLVACGGAGEAGAPGQAGSPGPAGPKGDTGEQGPAGAAAESTDLACTECHNDTTLITGKQAQWEESAHGSGTSFARGGSASCAGCHSGGAFSERIAAGLAPNELEAGDPASTRQECRACHEIHTTYSGEDWALETTDPVALFVYEGETFDGGNGNLCANCHQPRRVYPEPVDGMVEITSTHWGPHHGGESIMLLGLGGAGDVEGSPSAHAKLVENTCVDCHMGEGDDHSFEPNVAACQGCHTGAENFDINGIQTEVQALIDELEEKLIGLGLLDEEGHPAVDTVPEDSAAALWNWIYIAHEDNSLGVHNAKYTLALLEWSLDSLE